MSPISFPGLGIDNIMISRVAFYIGTKPVYWYGIIIAAGFLMGLLYVGRNSERLGVESNKLMDLVLWATPIAIVCSRLYYVLTSLSQYHSFYDIIAVWNGGLAIYGAVIGAIATALIYCRVKKMSIGSTLDLAALGFLIGQAIGRWGNFVNQEAYGTATALPWRMEIIQNGSPISVHPTFFYEFLVTASLFVILHFYSKRRKFAGEIFLLYTAFYGLGRGLIEGLRTDSLYVGSLRISQLVGILSFFVAGAAIIYIRTRLKKSRPEYIPKTSAENGGAEEKTEEEGQ